MPGNRRSGIGLFNYKYQLLVIAPTIILIPV